MRYNPHGDETCLTIAVGAIEIIRTECLAALDGLETGGILLGHPHGPGFAVTVAGGPGPHAVRQSHYFLRDRDHAQALANEAWKTDRSQWIGEWHTHPAGDLRPSETDIESYRRHIQDEELGFAVFISLIATVDPHQQVWALAWQITPDQVSRIEINKERP